VTSIWTEVAEVTSIWTKQDLDQVRCGPNRIWAEQDLSQGG